MELSVAKPDAKCGFVLFFLDSELKFFNPKEGEFKKN
jgi:hypothetical protein